MHCLLAGASSRRTIHPAVTLAFDPAALPSAVAVPTGVVRWLRGRGVTTIGDLVRVAPRPVDLCAAGLYERATFRLLGRIRVAVGLPWGEIAEHVLARSELGGQLVQIELGPPPPRPRKPKPPKVRVKERRAAARRAAVLARVEGRRQQVEAGLLESFRAWLREQSELAGRVLAGRAGLDGPPRTLHDLAGELGVSAARVGQIARRTLDDLRAEQGWIDEARRRVAATLSLGAVPLATLAGEPWWAAAVAAPAAFDYLGGDVLGGAFHRVEVDGEALVARSSAAEIEQAYTTLRAAVVRLPLSLRPKRVRALFDAAARGLDPVIAERLYARICAEMVGMERWSRALVAGGTPKARLLALLRAAPAPVRVAELPHDLQRRPFPAEVIHFGHALVGVERHFPDLSAWGARLVPAAVRWMDEGPPERQVHAGELLEALRDEMAIPAWLTDGHLALLLERHRAARSLGHLRFVSLSAPEDTRRLSGLDLAARILRAHGEPMADQTLLEAMAQEMSVMPGIIQQLAGVHPFLRFPGQRLGLVDRDLPGGDAARAHALDHLARRLTRRAPLDHQELALEVNGLSPDHARWTPSMCLAAVRSDARFHITHVNGVGVRLAR